MTPFLILNRVPCGLTQDPSTDPRSRVVLQGAEGRIRLSTTTAAAAGERYHLCRWLERIPGGTRQNDGLETEITGGLRPRDCLGPTDALCSSRTRMGPRARAARGTAVCAYKRCCSCTPFFGADTHEQHSGVSAPKKLAAASARRVPRRDHGLIKQPLCGVSLVLARTRHCTRRIRGVPGSAKRRFHVPQKTANFGSKDRHGDDCHLAV